MRPSEWQRIPFTSGNLCFTKRLWLPKNVTVGGVMCVLCLLEEDYDAPVEVAPGQWQDKDEHLYMPMEHAAYLAKPDYKANKKGPHSQHRATSR